MSDPTDNVTKVTIPPLSSNNCPTWSVLTREMLRREELLGLLGEDAPNLEVSAAAAVTRFKKRDRYARSYIVLHLGTEAIIDVTSILASDATANDVRTKLKSIYQRDNMQAKLDLESKLYALQYQDKEHMDQHLQTFNKIFVKPAALGVNVEDEDHVGNLLRSLPDSFNGLVSIAGAMNWNYDQLVAEAKSSIDRRIRTDINKSKDQKPITPGARKTIAEDTRQAGLGGHSITVICMAIS